MNSSTTHDTIGTPVERVDARGKSRGEARYIADYPVEGALTARFARADTPRGRIRQVHVPPMPDGYRFVSAADIPPEGANSVRMITDDWRVFAADEVRYVGEPLGLVVGPDPAVVDTLVDGVRLEVEEITPAFTEDEGIACVGGPIHGDDNLFSDKTIVKGDPDEAFRTAAQVVEDTFITGLQEHVYMEPQGLIGSMENGRLTLTVSTQCPFYVRKGVAHTMGVPPDEIVVRQSVTGGGFGGKEHFPDVLAAAVAVAVRATGRTVRLIMERGEDMRYSTKRHPSTVRYRAGLDDAGRLTALEADITINAGAYESGSSVVLQRAMFSAAGVYDVPHVRIRGRAVCTNTVPNDAFRGFGAPQALFAAEGLMNHLAHHLDVDAVTFRRKHVVQQGSVTVTNGHIHEKVLLPEMIDHLLEASDYRHKQALYGQGNGRGIGMSLFLHGSAFTGSGERDIIKARAALRKDVHGRVEIKVSTVEIGQGALTTLRKIVARELGLQPHEILYHPADTAVVPDSGPTCASRSVAIVGYLLQEAARRLKPQMHEPGEVEIEERYSHPPNLRWNGDALQGDAYPSFSWGANVVEVSVDPDTFEVIVEDVWTTYDVGRAIDVLVVQGQIEGGASQGLGYATLEKLELSGGVYAQVSMADYMIPTSLDFPPIHSALFDNPYEYGPSGAKGAGEVVFDGLAPALAAAVEQAIDCPVNALPVTPERIAELRRERTTQHHQYQNDDDGAGRTHGGHTVGDNGSLHPQWVSPVHHGQPHPTAP